MKGFKRAISFITLAALISGILLMLTDCGGGDKEPVEDGGNTIYGTFLDAPVDDLSYRSNPSHLAGMTKNGGQFICKSGDTVTFSIGTLVLGKVACQETVTPLTLVGTTDIHDPVVTNIARLLQTLDINEDPFTIIIDSSAADEVAGLTIDITNKEYDFDNDDNLKTLFSSLGDTPVSAETARNRLKLAVESQQNPPPRDFLGTYKFTKSQTGYLHLFSNGHYMYETSAWPGDCGADCKQLSKIRIFGTYVIVKNTLSLSPIVAQDPSGNKIQSDAIDKCWMFSSYYQTVSIPNIVYKNGIYFTAASSTSFIPERPKHCGGKPEITPAGSLEEKVNNTPYRYMIN